MLYLSMGFFKQTPEEKVAAKEARDAALADLKFDLGKAKESMKSELGKAKETIKSKREEILQAQSGEFPDATPQRLFNAILLAGADKKYSIVSIDRASFSVTFQSNKGEKFWDGKISCFVIPLEGMCRLSVSGNSEKGSSTSGFSIQNWSPLNQLASDGASTSEINKFKLAILRQFDKTPEPPAEEARQTVSSSGVADIPSQLKQLKELFDSGVLTQEEFEKAKSKLLT